MSQSKRSNLSGVVAILRGVRKSRTQTRSPLAVWRMCLLLWMTLLSSGLRAQIVLPAPYYINTVAGNGTAGYVGNGGPAISGELNYPFSGAVDAAGNLYIADSGNNRIRKVTASTGIITTIAGTGTAGYVADGVVATSAELNDPSSVAVDAAGNIFIGDSVNYRIRKVTASTGIITTVAGNGVNGYTGDGGAATNADLRGPAEVAVDAAGNLYFADGAWTVRKVTASTGIITTVAGNGVDGYTGDGGAATSAEMYYVMGVAVDAAGNLYIADTSNNRIRKVTASTGIITTVAGNGVNGYTGDGGAATSAELQFPYKVAVDADGNLYIATSNAIRKVTSGTGIITTVAGTGTAGYSGDGGTATNAKLNYPGVMYQDYAGVALDPWGNIYIADTLNNRIRVVGVPPQNTTTTVVSSNSSLYVGASVTFTATVRSAFGTPPGTVTFYSDGSPIGSGGLSGNTAAISTTTLAIGSHSITATYGGSTHYSTSTSSAITQQITQVPTGLTFNMSPNPSNYGSNVTIGISVTASNGTTPTGSVSVVANSSTSLGTPALSGGTASVNTSSLPVGANSITVSYPGNATYDSSSVTETETVNKVTPSLSVSCSPNPITYGAQNTNCYSSLTGGNSPTGSIVWTINGAGWTTTAINGSAGGFGWYAAGPYTIGVSYAGDSKNNAASGSTVLTIIKATPSNNVSLGSSSVVYGQTTTVAVQVGCNSACGSVDYRLDGGEWGTVSLSSSGSYTSPTGLAWSVGTHSIQVNYLGNGNYNAVSSSVHSFTITNPIANTTTQIASSLNPSTYGQNITFSAPVNTGGTLPTGTITFKDGGSSIGTGSVTPVNNTNELRYSTNFGAWGTNSGVTITPNATTAPDGSNTATLLTVGSGGQYYILDSFPCSAGVTTYSAWIMQGPNPSAFLVFTMRFSDASGNNIYIGFPGATIPASWTRESFTATAPAGTASCGIGLEQNGASGGGGTALPGQNVYAWGAQTEAASQPGPYISTNGSSASGYGGFASFTTSTLAAGTHPITAVYGGDANTLPSASSALAQVVNLGTPVVTTWPTASPINFGQTLASSTLSGGTASVAGTFSWTTPSTAPPLGTAPQSVTFTPTNTTDYNNVTGTASVTVNKQTQTITFPAPASPVIYGVAPIALSATASSGLPVTFTVISGPGTTSGSMGSTLTITGAGTLIVAVNQSGNGTYAAATQVTQSIVVSQAALTATCFSTLNPSTYGQSVTETCTFSGLGAMPAGTATVKVDGAVVATPTLDGSGAIAYTTAILAAGSHSVTAAYNGSANYY
jgi:hypothetical protein